MAIITIGVPCYNEDKYLKETIDSILNQDVLDVRVIISDNCSQDKTYEIAKYYESIDKRVVAIRQESNIGAVANFKFVLDACETKYFCWAGAHDLMDKSWLKAAIKTMDENEKIALCYPKTEYIDKNGNYVSRTSRPSLNQDSIDGDDIDTVGLNLGKALKKIASNLYECFAIHGVFRFDQIKGIPFYNTVSGDHTFLFCVGMQGYIKRINMVGIYIRIIREEMSIDETLNRYSHVCKIALDRQDPMISRHTMMALDHIRSIAMSSSMSPTQKVSLCADIFDILSNRFAVRWLPLFPRANTKQLYFLLSMAYITYYILKAPARFLQRARKIISRRLKLSHY